MKVTNYIRAFNLNDSGGTNTQWIYKLYSLHDLKNY